MSGFFSGREQAINHDTPRVNSLGRRALRKLGDLASEAICAVPPVPHGARGIHNTSETVSFLDAQKPPRTPLDDTLDELDARFDEATPPSADDIVIELVPQSSRPPDPNLN